ncbi:MAG: DNA/RNA non-specific endonuclease [Endozoicomonas sp.]|uniref:DNA/RNA non-specific endonuclease n=1 Tax=Endozoicomonas sp. TaxID=1892382 RepID=UPI003D9B6C6B
MPSAYFKVVATINSRGGIEASGFIMEQTAGRRDNYCRTEVAIDEIEHRTSLNFFPGLPVYKENAVENRTGGLSNSLGC